VSQRPPREKKKKKKTRGGGRVLSQHPKRPGAIKGKKEKENAILQKRKRKSRGFEGHESHHRSVCSQKAPPDRRRRGKRGERSPAGKVVITYPRRKRRPGKDTADFTISFVPEKTSTLVGGGKKRNALLICGEENRPEHRTTSYRPGPTSSSEGGKTSGSHVTKRKRGEVRSKEKPTLVLTKKEICPEERKNPLPIRGKVREVPGISSAEEKNKEKGGPTSRKEKKKARIFLRRKGGSLFLGGKRKNGRATRKRKKKQKQVRKRGKHASVPSKEAMPPTAEQKKEPRRPSCPNSDKRPLSCNSETHSPEGKEEREREKDQEKRPCSCRVDVGTRF